MPTDLAKLLRLPILAGALVLAGAPAIAAPKTFLVGSFEELRVEGDITVILDNTKPPSAKATGDHALVQALKIEQSGMRVRIRIQDYEGKARTARVNQPLVVKLGGRGIKRIAADGSATVSVNQIKEVGGLVLLKVAGTGSISVSSLEADRINVGMNGSGTITIGSGQARQGEFNIDGTGTVSGPQFTLQQAKLQQDGSAKTHLFATEQVEITNRGAGNITIDGKATCFIRQPGSARIICGKPGK